YSHRFDPETPLEETMGALDTAVRQGKALYAGISSYSAAKTREAHAILRELGTPLLIHQPSYSLLNRWIEPDLLDALGELGVGCIVFSPLAQGMLTNKYLNGIPPDSRAAGNSSLSPDLLSDAAMERIRGLNEIAQARGQTVARRRRFARNEVVFHHDDLGDSLHLIVKGRFAIRIVAPFGESAMIRVRGPGEHFGEMALISEGPRRAATVFALEAGETFAV